MDIRGVNIKWFLLNKPSDSVNHDGVSDKVDAKLFVNSNFGDQVNGKNYDSFKEGSDEAYDLDHGTRIAFIFNHHQFQDKNISPRDGTQKDVDAICETFGSICGSFG